MAWWNKVRYLLLLIFFITLESCFCCVSHLYCSLRNVIRFFIWVRPRLHHCEKHGNLSKRGRAIRCNLCCTSFRKGFPLLSLAQFRFKNYDFRFYKKQNQQITKLTSNLSFRHPICLSVTQFVFPTKEESHKAIHNKIMWFLLRRNDKKHSTNKKSFWWFVRKKEIHLKINNGGYYGTKPTLFG